MLAGSLGIYTMSLDVENRWFWTLAAAFWLILALFIPDTGFRFLFGLWAVFEIVIATLLWREFNESRGYWLGEARSGGSD